MAASMNAWVDRNPAWGLLGQQVPEQATQILWWLLVIALAAAVIIAVALFVRGRLMVEEEEETSPGFLLSDLRAMHAAGKLSDEEFAAAKARMIAQSRAILHDESPAEAGETDRPFPTDLDEADAPTQAEAEADADEDGEIPGPEDDADSDKR